MRFLRMTSTASVYSRLHTYKIPLPKRCQTTRPIQVAIEFLKLVKKVCPKQRLIVREGKRIGNRIEEDSLNVIKKKIGAAIGRSRNKTIRGDALYPQLWHFIASWTQLCFRLLLDMRSRSSLN